MFLRLILFTVLGYYIFKTIRKFLLAHPKQPQVKSRPGIGKEEDFQKKNQSKIEDADFEELE